MSPNDPTPPASNEPEQEADEISEESVYSLITDVYTPEQEEADLNEINDFWSTYDRFRDD